MFEYGGLLWVLEARGLARHWGYVWGGPALEANGGARSGGVQLSSQGSHARRRRSGVERERRSVRERETRGMAGACGTCGASQEATEHGVGLRR